MAVLVSRSTNPEHNEVPLLGPSLLSGMPLSEAMIASAPPAWPKPGSQQREMMKRMDAGQHSIALGAETVSHEGLRVDDKKLRAITVPTLVIYGGNDHAAFYAEAKSRFPNLQFKTIESASHSEFLADIREFLGHYASDTSTIPSKAKS